MFLMASRIVYMFKGGALGIIFGLLLETTGPGPSYETISTLLLAVVGALVGLIFKQMRDEVVEMKKQISEVKSDVEHIKLSQTAGKGHL